MEHRRWHAAQAGDKPGAKLPPSRCRAAALTGPAAGAACEGWPPAQVCGRGAGRKWLLTFLCGVGIGWADHNLSGLLRDHSPGFATEEPLPCEADRVLDR